MCPHAHENVCCYLTYSSFLTMITVDVHLLYHCKVYIVIGVEIIYGNFIADALSLSILPSIPNANMTKDAIICATGLVFIDIICHYY